MEKEMLWLMLCLKGIFCFLLLDKSYLVLNFWKKCIHMIMNFLKILLFFTNLAPMGILGTTLICLKRKYCVTKCSIRDLLVREEHEGWLMGHFGGLKYFIHFVKTFLLASSNKVVSTKHNIASDFVLKDYLP